MISFFLFFYLFLLVPLWFLYPFFPLLFFLCSFQSAYSLFFFFGFMPLFVFLLRLFVLCFSRFRSHVFSSFPWLFLFSPACSSLRLLVFCPLVFPSVFSVCFSPSRPRVFSSFGFLCFFRPVLDCEGRLGFCYRSSEKKLKSPSGFFGLFPSLCFHPYCVAFLWLL